jgi:hypothetical protein
MNRIKNLFPSKIAYFVFVAISIFAQIYHALIITQIVPYANAWGGRLTSVEVMYVFETVSIVVQLLFIVTSTIKYRLVGSKRLQLTMSIFLYAIAGLLAVNTLGNIFTTSSFEAIVFTPMTLIGSLCAFRLAQE